MGKGVGWTEGRLVGEYGGTGEVRTMRIEEGSGRIEVMFTLTV